MSIDLNVPGYAPVALSYFVSSLATRVSTHPGFHRSLALLG